MNDPEESRMAPAIGMRTGRESDPEPIRLNRLWLRFVDAEIEDRYRRDHILRVTPIVRLALICGALLYGLFGLLDVYLIDQNLAYVLAMRFGLGCGTLLVAFGLTFTRIYQKYNQLVVSVAMLNCGLGVVAMTVLAGSPANETYYAGLIMVIIYAAILIHGRIIYVVGITVTLVVAYFLAIMLLAPLPTPVLVNNSFFLIMSLGVSIFAGYGLELGWRQRFSRYLALQHATDIAVALKNDAVSANHAKTEFLATMSHELRTPLNAILGFSDIMKAGMYGPLGSSKYDDYAEDIHDSARHLLSIISDILDYAKSESGIFELDETDVDGRDLIERSMRICHQLAAGKGIRMCSDYPEWTPVIRADRRLMQQVLVNLLSNAIKFTPSAGEVRLQLSNGEGGGCRMTVSDTGIGIAKEDQARVFEAFTQVQSAYVRDAGGTGLGLPLVRRVVEMHQGDVSLTSRLGQGTSVTIDLPPSRTIGFAEFDSTGGPGIRHAS